MRGLFAICLVSMLLIGCSSAPCAFRAEGVVEMGVTPPSQPADE